MNKNQKNNNNLRVFERERERAHSARGSAEDFLLIIQLKYQFRILGLMNTDFIIDHHEEFVAAFIKLHIRRFFAELAVEAPPSSHQIDQRQAVIVANG